MISLVNGAWDFLISIFYKYVSPDGLGIRVEKIRVQSVFHLWLPLRPAFSNHRSVGDDGVFGNDDDAVADVIKCVVELFRFAGGRNRYVAPDARVFVNDGVLDFAVCADAEARLAIAFVRFDGFLRFVIIAAEDDDTVQLAAGANDGAQADNAVGDARLVDNAAVGDEHVINVSAVDFGAGQIPRAAENRRAHVEEVEPRQFRHEVEVRLEKRADGADVLPVALKNVGEHAARTDGVRDDVLAKIRQRVVKQFADQTAVENVNAHRGEVQFAATLDAQFSVPLGRQPERVEQGGVGRFFGEPRDAPVLTDLQDAQ